MNINGFLKKFGNKTFEEMPFNNVDGLILAELSYINIDFLMKDDQSEICIKDIDFKHIDKSVFYDSVDASYNKTMLKLMATGKRYKDIIIKDIVRRFSNQDVNQFLAMTIVLPNDDLYLSFRGTDITLVGWKEDFLLTYQSKLIAQIQALEYADNVLSKCENKFYLGGHSKGGNLAFYAALNLGKEIDDRLIYAYSYDGPGFRDGIKHYESFERIRKRMIKFVTYFDVIGSVFTDIKRQSVVHSTGILFGGHDPFFWQVDYKSGDFMYAKSIAPASKAMNKKFAYWLNSLTYDDRALATDALFEIFKGNETIYDLFKNAGKGFIGMRKTLSRYSKDEQSRLKTILKKFFQYIIFFSAVSEKKNKNSSEEELL